MHPLLESGDESIYTLRTKAPGPTGILPFSPEQLKNHPSGNLFGWTQNVGMGWDADKVGQRLSGQGKSMGHSSYNAWLLPSCDQFLSGTLEQDPPPNVKSHVKYSNAQRHVSAIST